jgi:hypothetical protein
MVVNANHMPLALFRQLLPSREQGLRQTLVYQMLKYQPAFKRKPLKYIKYLMYTVKNLGTYELRIRIQCSDTQGGSGVKRVRVNKERVPKSANVQN